MNFLWLEKDDREVLNAMAKLRMDSSAFVGKLLEEQDGEVLREGIRALAGVTERSNAATEERLKTGHAVGGVSIV